ncbi:MAG: HAMP domain-containing protein [Deltaproteobacteria bacterium]|nr:HAMP domain-containing protein [Deltaproteobacteria bacterium]
MPEPRASSRRRSRAVRSGRFALGLRVQTLASLTLAFALSFGLLGLALIRVSERGRALDRARDHRAAARAVALAYRVGEGDRHARFLHAADAVLGEAGIRGVELTRPDFESDVRGIVGLGQVVEAELPGGETLRLWVRAPDPSTGVPVTRLLLLYVALTGGGVLLLAYFTLTALVVRPLDLLTQAASRVASGNLEVDVPERGAGEVARLARAFNLMSEQLAADRAALEEKIAELERTTRELAQAQEQVLRSERLASVGRLSAGVAHEIGNPLAAVRGLLEIAADEEDAGERSEYLSRAQAETDRISRIIRELLDFARQGVERAPESASADLHAVVVDAVRLASARGEQVSFAIDAPADLPAARIEPDRALQVVLNLLLNAADALDGQGHVRIAVEREDEASLRLVVEDDGPGIPERVLGQIFEPFVTTKPVGQGTGLGLAVCHTLITQVGGRIDAENLPDGGARFELHLPIEAGAQGDS